MINVDRGIGIQCLVTVMELVRNCDCDEQVLVDDDFGVTRMSDEHLDIVVL